MSATDATIGTQCWLAVMSTVLSPPTASAPTTSTA
jgi:hypothetical protein